MRFEMLRTIGVLLLSLAVLSLLWLIRPTPAERIAPTWAVPPPPSGLHERIPAAPPTLAPTPAIATEMLLVQPNLDVAIPADLYHPADHLALALQLDQALAYVSARFGSPPASRMRAQIVHDQGCMLRGLARTDQRVLEVLTCNDLPHRRVINIAAHEFVHQLAYDRYGAVHMQSDLIMLEGIATWGAGSYWLGGSPSFRDFVRDNYSANLLPLATHYRGRSIHEMNQLYYQWASFVEFLLETHGRERLDALAVTGNREPGSGDYVGVYGVPLGELEQAWQAWQAH